MIRSLVWIFFISEFILIYLNSNVKQVFLAYVNYSCVHFWNQPVLSNEGKISCSMNQQKHLMGIEFTHGRLGVQMRYPLCHTTPLS